MGETDQIEEAMNKTWKCWAEESENESNIEWNNEKFLDKKKKLVQKKVKKTWMANQS